MTESENENFLDIKLFSNGFEIDTDSRRFGWLIDSTTLLNDSSSLRERLENDGYLYFTEFLNREEVEKAHMVICQVLSIEGSLDERFPIHQAVPRQGVEMRLRTDIANQSPVKEALDELTLNSRVLALFENLLGNHPVKRFPWMWLRTMTPGKGTAFHSDIVYMGRGTHQLYTSWFPLSDIPLDVGGLILVEKSHCNQHLRETYCKMDVDVICTNMADNQSQMNAAGYPGYGALCLNPVSAQRQLGGRILTARNFKMGDLLIFSAFTVHGSLDNKSDQIRLSVDTRYQLEREPIDERWQSPSPQNRMVRYTVC